MRILPALLFGLLGAAAIAAGQGEDKGTKRYGVELNLDKYPQATPQEALRSAVKALQEGKVYYLVAQLSDPRYVDPRVREYKAGIGEGPEEGRAILAFDRLVREISEHFREDPSLLRELQKLSREGEWQPGEDRASVSLKSSPNRRAFLRKIQDRWFLENRQQ